MENLEKGNVGKEKLKKDTSETEKLKKCNSEKEKYEKGKSGKVNSGKQKLKGTILERKILKWTRKGSSEEGKTLKRAIPKKRCSELDKTKKGNSEKEN